MDIQANLVSAALEVIRESFDQPVRAAIILGTGLGELADHIKAVATIPYGSIPNFPHSTALSHKGQLVCGHLDDVPVVAMQGRCHMYEGYCSNQLALPVKVMNAMGAELLIVSNAGGGVNPQFAAGDIVVLEDHINLMWDVGLGLYDQPPAGRQSGRLRHTYCPGLIDKAMSVARTEGFALHRGVYVGVTGPNYETRAEYRMFRQIGGDVVGMSTIAEVLAAAQCDMRTLAFSMVTNVAIPDSPETVDADDVVVIAQQCEPNMRSIVREAIHWVR